ncbi:MAG: hypothetical protein ACYDBB_07535 [Armatimonadota bacterium]
MKGLRQGHWLVAGVISLGILVMLAGCGGGGGGDTPIIPPTQNVDPSKPTAIGGVLWTLDGKMLDSPYNAEITLTGTPDDPLNGTSVTRKIATTLLGSYHFDNLPQGTYTLSATVQGAKNPDIVLSGTLQGIRALGNFPNLMVNLLLGSADKMATISGTITQNDAPRAAASVTLAVKAYSIDYLQNGAASDSMWIYLNTTTGTDGKYAYQVPADALAFVISVHSDTSAVNDSNNITDLTAGETRTVDMTLIDAPSSSFVPIVLDVISNTLPEPTVLASQRALMTQIALAKAKHAPAARLARLQRLAQRQYISRSIGGMVDNNLLWDVNGQDQGVQGYYVYRATAATGPFEYIGGTNDLYFMTFFDNSPSLNQWDRVYYKVACYAANGKISAPSDSVTAQPLPAISLISPANNATVTSANARIRWQAVPDAKWYTVTVYDHEPTFNITEVRYHDVAADTFSTEFSQSISTLPSGTYWWSVSAYNTEDTNYATAISSSDYQVLTISAE